MNYLIFEFFFRISLSMTLQRYGKFNCLLKCFSERRFSFSENRGIIGYNDSFPFLLKAREEMKKTLKTPLLISIFIKIAVVADDV